MSNRHLIAQQMPVIFTLLQTLVILSISITALVQSSISTLNTQKSTISNPISTTAHQQLDQQPNSSTISTSTENATPYFDEEPSDFLDDMFPFEYNDIDCGEDTAVTQRQLQLDLLIETAKSSNLPKYVKKFALSNTTTTITNNNDNNSNPLEKNTNLDGNTSIFSEFEKFIHNINNGDLTQDTSLDHIWFASCNNQNFEQEMWYHFYKKSHLSSTLQLPPASTSPFPSISTSTNPIQPQHQNSTFPTNLGPNSLEFPQNRRKFGQLFLWLGDSVYLDRAPVPFNTFTNSKISDFTRQAWKKHYCLGVRRQIPINGIIDDHDFGLNDAGFDFEGKFETKGMFYDFLDFPHSKFMGVSRQFNEVVLQDCGRAIGCHGDANGENKSDIVADESNNPNVSVRFQPLTQECRLKVIQTIKSIHHSTKTGELKPTTSASSQFPSSTPKAQKSSLPFSNPIYNPEVQHRCYVNWQTILHHDTIQDNIYSTSRTFVSPKIFKHDYTSSNSTPHNPQPTTSTTLSASHSAPTSRSTSTSQSPPISTPTPPIHPPTHIALSTLLTHQYQERRNRHGTWDVQVFGPLFRRTKTLLLDVRVGLVLGQRMLLETHWAMFEENLKNSVIPSVCQIYFGSQLCDQQQQSQYTPNSPPHSSNHKTNGKNNNSFQNVPKIDETAMLNNPTSFIPNLAEIGLENMTLEQRSKTSMVFQWAVSKIMLEWSKFDESDGRLLFSPPKPDQSTSLSNSPLLSTLQLALQCQSPQFALSAVLQNLTKYENFNFLENSADLVLIGTGLLLVSWGKMAAEGWREQHTERTRMLTRTSKHMAISKQRVDEWKIYLQSRNHICGNFFQGIHKQEELESQSDQHAQQQTWNNDIPYVTYKTPSTILDMNNPANSRETNTTPSNTESKDFQNYHQVRHSLVDVIRPMAVSYISGDVHFSEGARTYIPVDLSVPDPKVVSNSFHLQEHHSNCPNPNVNLTDEFMHDHNHNDEVVLDDSDLNKKSTSHTFSTHPHTCSIPSPNQHIYNSHADESAFFATNDTIRNGNSAIHFLQLSSNSSLPLILSAINQTMNINSINSIGKLPQNNIQKNGLQKNQKIAGNESLQTLETRPLFPRLLETYVAPLQDITTSGITHAWCDGDHDPLKVFAITTLFNIVLRPDITTIDFKTKHGFLIDDLEQLYDQMNNFPTPPKQTTSTSSSKSTQPPIFPMDKSTFNHIRTNQERVFLLHNIGEIFVDWEHDLVHFVISNKNLENVHYYSSKLEHIRAYSLPQINTLGNSLITQLDSNHAPAPEAGFKNSPTINTKRYLEDMHRQIMDEAFERVLPPFVLTHDQSLGLAVSFGSLIVLAIIYCYKNRVCCCYFCPVRRITENIVADSTTKQTKNVISDHQNNNIISVSTAPLLLHPTYYTTYQNEKSRSLSFGSTLSHYSDVSLHDDDDLDHFDHDCAENDIHYDNSHGNLPFIKSKSKMMDDNETQHQPNFSSLVFGIEDNEDTSSPIVNTEGNGSST